ncbi:MAG: hypothetical protein K8R99_15850 [Actinomycetia bacterium]|nr:hypothetical protein [Actinomycetes bacterium]
MSRLFVPLPADRFVQRLARCIAGLAMFGLGISMFLASDLGVPAWDVFHQGISRKTDIPIGLIIEISSAFVLLLWIPLRQRLGLGTLLNAIEIGLVVFLIGDHLPHSERIVWRLAYIAGAMFVVAIGSGLYIGAGLGSGPRDGLMLGLAQRGISIRVARTGVELTVLAAGLALGGSVGIATVVFTFGIGPLCQIFLPRLRMRGDKTVLATAH